jgi:hypothetical protein
MRRPLIALACVCSVASADPKKPKPIDISSMVDKLDVFKDDLGNVYVSPRPGLDLDDASKWVFYGDSKTLYQQRVIGESLSSGQHYTWNVWAPRAKGMQSATVDLNKGVLAVTCRTKDKRPLTQLNADEAKTLLQHAKLYPPLWQREAHLLARDDDAVYYYVDDLREEYGGNGYRLFVGPKGAMKEVPLANVATDTAGEIFATKSGQLKLVANEGSKAYWSKGGKKVELTIVDPWPNRYLIYRELGIYGSLGTVCDDQ